jgi:hypothetical protein
MVKQEELLKIIEEIDSFISCRETEAGIHKYCAEHGLDAGKAWDYSKAVIAVLEYEIPGNERAERPRDLENLLNIDSEEFASLLTAASNNVSLKNELKPKMCSIYSRVEALSEYGWLKPLLKRAVRAVFGAAEVINRSGATIAVAGQKERNAAAISIYLGPGERSLKYLYDTDAVVILPGQTYIFGPITVTGGAIKISDGFTAKVTRDSNGIFSVIDISARYYDEAAARNHGWTPPRH